MLFFSSWTVLIGATLIGHCFRSWKITGTSPWLTMFKREEKNVFEQSQLNNIKPKAQQQPNPSPIHPREHREWNKSIIIYKHEQYNKQRKISIIFKLMKKAEAEKLSLSSCCVVTRGPCKLSACVVFVIEQRIVLLQKYFVKGTNTRQIERKIRWCLSNNASHNKHVMK